MSHMLNMGAHQFSWCATQTSCYSWSSSACQWKISVELSPCYVTLLTAISPHYAGIQPTLGTKCIKIISPGSLLVRDSTLLMSPLVSGTDHWYHADINRRGGQLTYCTSCQWNLTLIPWLQSTCLLLNKSQFQQGKQFDPFAQSPRLLFTLVMQRSSCQLLFC